MNGDAKDIDHRLFDGILNKQKFDLKIRLDENSNSNQTEIQ